LVETPAQHITTPLVRVEVVVVVEVVVGVEMVACDAVTEFARSVNQQLSHQQHSRPCSYSKKWARQYLASRAKD